MRTGRAKFHLSRTIPSVLFLGLAGVVPWDDETVFTCEIRGLFCLMAAERFTKKASGAASAHRDKTL
jgi:hypothetical protein